MISPEGYAKLTSLLCAILINQEELAYMIELASYPDNIGQTILSTTRQRIRETVKKALEPMNGSFADALLKIVPGPEKNNDE